MSQRFVVEDSDSDSESILASISQRHSSSLTARSSNQPTPTLASRGRGSHVGGGSSQAGGEQEGMELMPDSSGGEPERGGEREDEDEDADAFAPTTTTTAEPEPSQTQGTTEDLTEEIIDDNFLDE